MKICLLSYRGNPYSGGQGIYLKYIAEEMVRQGHEVHAVTGPPHPHKMEGVVTHEIENNGYFVRKGLDIINAAAPFDIFSPINFYEYLNTRLGAFSEISAFSYRAFSLLKKLHAEHGFDVIHDNQCVGYGMLMMKQLGIPVISTIHHPLSIDLVNVLERVSTFKKKLKTIMFYPTLMQSIVAKKLDGIITVSEDSKRRIHSDFGVPLENQRVVYNGIDTDIFRPMDEVKKIQGRLIFVGNVEDGKKGFVYLLSAMRNIDKKITLTVVDGGSPHRNITSVLMDKYKLHDRVFFTGKASGDDLVRYYNEAEIALVPSVYEGFGFPAGEAMACGVPVIASDGGALPEVTGDAGITIPARDDRAISDAVNSLMGNSSRLREMSEAGIARVKEKFRWDTAVRQMTDYFQEKIDSGR
jgi:glycosyltransferase involved in cell wall biosynthesis